MACAAGNGEFRLYFFGSVLSDFGTWLQNSAQVLLAFQLTHSVLAVGLVTFAQFTSPLVLGPWAGLVADKFGGRRTLLGTQITSAVVAATLAWMSAGNSTNWASSPARSSAASPSRSPCPRETSLCSDSSRPRSSSPPTAWTRCPTTSVDSWAPFLTITIGAAGINFAWAFAANAASFIAFSVILWRIHLPAAKGKQASRVRDRLMAGFRILFRSPDHDPAAYGGRGYRRG